MCGNRETICQEGGNRCVVGERGKAIVCDNWYKTLFSTGISPHTFVAMAGASYSLDLGEAVLEIESDDEEQQLLELVPRKYF